METLFTTEQVRALDAWGIANVANGANAKSGGGDLMRRAGASCYRLLRARWPRARRFAILTGPGNNGGDGWVVARHLLAAGDEVTVYELAAPDVSSDAGVMRAEYLALIDDDTDGRGRVRPLESFALADLADLIVDALFGSGLTRALNGAALAAVRAMNRVASPVLAIDVPTGLDSDTGVALPIATRAEVTLTFVGRKRGMYTGCAKAYCGEVVFDSLGVDAGQADIDSRVRLAGACDVALPARPAYAHKGHCGRVLTVGGNTGMGGAARLAGEAAMRSGAGLVYVALRPGNLIYAAVCPVLMAREVAQAAELEHWLSSADVVAIGPGLGRDAWAMALFSKTLDSRKPLVVDADGLRLLAEEPTRRDDWILTPHPGEAAALLATSSADIEANRFAAAAQIAEQYGGACVLKGAGTVVSDANETMVCVSGNAAMATGGMGDVLTGIVTGLWAQSMQGGWHWDVFKTAWTSVCAHGAAADDAAGGRQRGLVAADLFAHLGAWENE